MKFKMSRGSVVPGGSSARWDYEAILATARLLEGMGDAGEARKLLEGEHVALLSEPGSSGDADLFVRAARGLGAQVAEVRAELWPTLPREEIHRVALMLGCLYAAVECQGPFRSFVPLIEAAACIPAYDHVSSPDHPTAQLAKLLEGDAPPEEKRRLVLQAVLLGTIA